MANDDTVTYRQVEHHQVIVTKKMCASLTDWEGNTIVTMDELKEYIETGTTGDDAKDDFCWDRIAEAECVDEEDINWFSDNKGFTEIERSLLDDEEV
jgi:beta-N-acetylglucosaminidase